MANSIDIDINGNYDDFRKAADGAIAKLEQLSKEEEKWAAWSEKVTRQTQAYMSVQRQKEAALKAEADATRSATMSWTDFHSMYSTVLDIARVGQQVFDATISRHLEYADSVRQLSLVSGTSAEESSRLIQVLDDYGISAQSAMTATRALTKEGYAPTIETLAQLSDEYLSLETAQEKNEFILKNLGRSGLEYVEVLNKGSDAIRAQGAAVADNLILNQKHLDDALRLKVAFDNFNDAVFGAGETLSTKLTPFLADAVDGFLLLLGTVQRMPEALRNGETLGETMAVVAAEIRENEAAMIKAGKAAGEYGDGLGELEGQTNGVTEAQRNLSQELQNTLSNMFSVNSQQEKFTESMKSNAEKEEDLGEKRRRTEYEFFLATEEHQQKLRELERAIGQADNAEERRKAKERLLHEQNKYVQEDTISYYEKLADIDEDIAKNQEDRAKLEEDYAKEQKRAIYDMVQQRLQASDGMLDSGEFEYLQKIAVQTGLVTQADADRAVAASQAADRYVMDFEKQQSLRDTELSTIEKQVQAVQTLVGYNGTVVDIQVNMRMAEDGSMVPANWWNQGNTFGTNGINYSSSFGSGQGSPMYIPAGSRDAGGAGMAGQPYLIGTGAQPELFVPDRPGQFYPNAGKGGWGNTYNITINNPKRETAENSIRRALKNLSFLGVTQNVD